MITPEFSLEGGLPCNSWQHFWAFAGYLNQRESTQPHPDGELAGDNYDALWQCFESLTPEQQIEAVDALWGSDSSDEVKACLRNAVDLWKLNPEAALMVFAIAAEKNDSEIAIDVVEQVLAIINKGSGYYSKWEVIKPDPSEEQRDRLSEIVGNITCRALGLDK